MNKRLFIALVAGTILMNASISLAKERGKASQDKFMQQVKLVYAHQETLGISAEQLDQLKTLKIDYKKTKIKQEAAIELIKVDIHAALWSDTIDVESVNKLIDAKYAEKKSLAKAKIKALADLKNLLTAEQKSKINQMLIAKYTGKGCAQKNGPCPMMKKK